MSSERPPISNHHTRSPGEEHGVILTKPCLSPYARDAGCRWEPNSYGYLGEDGKKWHNFEGYEYGSPHQSGDVIGAGIHLERQEIFFT